MNETLIVFLPETVDGAVVWRRWSDRLERVMDEGVVHAGETFQAPPQDVSQRVLAVAPGSAVFARVRRLRGRSMAEMRRAAAYLCEEDLGCDPLALSWAVGPERADGRRALRAVARDLAERWRDILQPLRAERVSVAADFDLTAPEDGAAELWRLGERWVLAAEEEGGTSGEGPLILWALKALPAQTRLVAYGWPDAGDPPAEVEVEVRPRLSAEEELGRIARHAGQAVELLQGPLKIRTRARLHLKRWRTAAAMAAAALLVFVLSGLLETIRIGGAADRVERRAEQEFRAAFPEVNRIVNLRGQARARVNRTVEGAGYLELMAMVADAIGATQGVGVEAVRYDGREGALDLSLIYPDYAAAERFKAAIEASGARFEERAARQREGVVAGEARVTAR